MVNILWLWTGKFPRNFEDLKWIFRLELRYVIVVIIRKLRSFKCRYACSFNLVPLNLIRILLIPRDTLPHFLQWIIIICRWQRWTNKLTIFHFFYSVTVWISWTLVRGDGIHLCFSDGGARNPEKGPHLFFSFWWTLVTWFCSSDRFLYIPEYLISFSPLFPSESLCKNVVTNV